MNKIQTFEFKYGHVACVNMLINRQQETGPDGRVIRGVNRDTGRMIGALTDSLELEDFDGTGKPLKEVYKAFHLSDLELKWIKDEINKVFDASLMPIWASRYAFDILEWQMEPEEVKRKP